MSTVDIDRSIYLPTVDICWHLVKYLPTSSCQRSFWTTPKDTQSPLVATRRAVGWGCCWCSLVLCKSQEVLGVLSYIHETPLNNIIVLIIYLVVFVVQNSDFFRVYIKGATKLDETGSVFKIATSTLCDLTDIISLFSGKETWRICGEYEINLW